jgi:hypothetical protein
MLPLSLLLLFQVLGQQPESPRQAVACLFASWNTYDVEASKRCYADSAVALRGSVRTPLDWDLEGGYRSFDAAAHSVFRYQVLEEQDSLIEVRLWEHNAFLTALGLSSISARWRYLVRQGRIAQEEHLERDSGFAVRYQQFRRWAQETRPGNWGAALDATGEIRFDGGTAPLLIGAARRWRRTGGGS